MKHIEIGITGGIGSGKSVVSQVLRAMQYPVYDTDYWAKQLMQSATIQQQVIDTWGQKILALDGSIDRVALAQIVFNNPQELARLNNIVHPVVRAHYAQWVENQHSNIVFVESAILYQAKMDKTLQHIWCVQADEETRIKRVMHRNNLTREQVLARIATQQTHFDDKRITPIVNDDKTAVIPQIISAINAIC